MSSVLDRPIRALEDMAIPLTSPVTEGPADIIPGLLPKQGQLIIAGETNIGKSLIALEICSALTTGTKLWGELQPTIQAKKILYILGEHYDQVIQRLWQHTQLPMSDQVWLLGPEKLGADKWLISNGKQNIQAISKLQKWSEGCDLIVFDPFTAFVSGVDVENDNIQMRLVLDSMSLVSQSSGASCLVLAHQGKPIMGKDGVEYHRKSYAIRGASGIEDAATNIFYMGKADGDSNAAHNLPPDMKVFNMVCRKYKGSAPDSYKLLRDAKTLTHSLLGNRPFVEVKKIDIQAKVTRVLTNFPSMDMKDAIKAVAAIQGISEGSVKQYLGIA